MGGHSFSLIQKLSSIRLSQINSAFACACVCARHVILTCACTTNTWIWGCEESSRCFGSCHSKNGREWHALAIGRLYLFNCHAVLEPHCGLKCATRNRGTMEKIWPFSNLQWIVCNGSEVVCTVISRVTESHLAETHNVTLSWNHEPSMGHFSNDFATFQPELFSFKWWKSCLCKLWLHSINSMLHSGLLSQQFNVHVICVEPFVIVRGSSNCIRSTKKQAFFATNQ